ncbi:hypothetical protein [Brevibacillus migulae]|uniref:hypothetical protein n=1 Tax=Brevibacillus migulae TaxID=1644114 RepID=UPI00106DDC2D|nr:hypothetical protein [Brevibacillus migulae]
MKLKKLGLCSVVALAVFGSAGYASASESTGETVDADQAAAIVEVIDQLDTADSIIRAELSKVLARKLGIDTSSTVTPSSFTDVDYSTSNYVEAARQAGVLEGIPSGIFGGEK